MKGHKASRSRKMDMGVDEPRMDRDDRPTRSNNNNPAVENAAEARKSGGRAKMKRVGMVEGMKAMGHAGRKPRGLGGQTEGGSTGLYIRRKGGFADRALRAAAPTGYGGSEDESSPGSPMSAPSRSASPGEGAMTGKGRAQPAPRPRPSAAVRSGPTPGELEADRLMAKYNTSAERGASPGEEALLRDMRAQADPEERERTKSYNTASDMGLKNGGTARKARASGGRTGSNNAPLSSAHMGDRSPTASKEIG